MKKVSFLVVVLTGLTLVMNVWAQEGSNEVFMLRVKKGWTLSKLGESFNTCYQKLGELNQLSNPDLIYAGQLLKVPAKGEVNVSWYGAECQGRIMANGKKFDMDDNTIVAHQFLPFGTKVRLTRLDNPAKSVVVIVQDRGPSVKGRQFNVSFAAAKLLEMVEEGVIKCRYTILEN